MATTKELIIQSGEYQCLVDVSATDTLADVRPKILEEFDDDMLPGNDFYIRLGTIRLSSKQELRKLAWDVIATTVPVSIHVRSATSGAGEKRSSSAVGSEDGQLLSKKNRIVNEDSPLSSTSTTSELNRESIIDGTNEKNGTDKQSARTREPGDAVYVMKLHKKYNDAVDQSRKTLNELGTLIKHPDNAPFCPESCRLEWSSRIATILEDSAPDTIIGCLGGTGVGKSSLLNALLDEAAILPTSGSRGCTAAVVELRFNWGLLKAQDQVDVYKGEVEFMTLQEWHEELETLVDECSSRDCQTIYTKSPDEQHNPEAAAAWRKINEVYGRGTMKGYAGESKAQVLECLRRDERIIDLLTPPQGAQTNIIVVREGSVHAAEAKQLAGQLSDIKGSLRRSLKKWAKDFRNKINDYVYRKGKKGEPQTWPLIRKVVLHGPWAVLSTGACLVDLPGVRDANAARAKVAQSYIRNCNKIWIVAPIKRAVDDGTAKELLGEQFKRRLLMDGQYSNVSFICTQTDDCEATEIMRDHEDVARREEGRWETMVGLRDQISALGDERADLAQQQEDFMISGHDASECGSDSEASGSSENIQANSKMMQRLQENSNLLQRRLKALCAKVRNEYSTSSLQADFRAGLEELRRNPDDGESNDNEESADDSPPPLPETFQMEVHCISSNDYLKIKGIKLDSDGPPNTFSNAYDTQIPALRAAVHITTTQFRSRFSQSVCRSTSDFLDCMKLTASKSKQEDASAYRYHQAFQAELKNLDAKLAPIASQFLSKTEEKVNAALEKSLKSAAAKGTSAAMSIVRSWGASARRSKHQRGPGQNGLHFCTYQATVRRNGVYVSKTAGEVDMNSELLEPMEKAFSADWQRTMDGAIRDFLSESEREVTSVLVSTAQSVVAAFAKEGMNPERLRTMANVASRSSSTALERYFEIIRGHASNAQKDLNRSLLPKIKKKMAPGYHASYNAPGGKGTFSRMKDALEDHSERTVVSMFDKATSELLKAIRDLLKDLADKILEANDVIENSLASAYSVCWADEDKMYLMDPDMQKKVWACRDKILPVLMRLRKVQDEALGLVGVERKDLELEALGLDKLEETPGEETKEDEGNGKFPPLSSDSEGDDSGKKFVASSPTPTVVLVSTDPTTRSASADTSNGGNSNHATVTHGCASTSHH